MTRRSFNTSIEGQPLQLFTFRNACVAGWKFQSLYRGTAFATLSKASKCRFLFCFNPSIEGQPLQPKRTVNNPRPYQGVSIPLSRDSLCNLSSSLMIRNINSWFQSLYRGTAFATLLLSHGMNIVVLPVSIPLSRDSLCNFDMADTNTNPTASVSIPLSRDSLCNFIGWDG